MLKSHAETFFCAFPSDIGRYALPFLRENWHLTFLQGLELLIRQDEEDRLVPVAEQPGLVALIDDSEAESASLFNGRLLGQACHCEIELSALLDSLCVRQ